MTAKCPCQHCSGKIEFDVDAFFPDMVVECPHCHCETILFIPALPPPKTSRIPAFIPRKLNFSPTMKFFGVVLLVAVVMTPVSYNSTHSWPGAFASSLIYSMLFCGATGLALAFYFMPSIIARNRKKRNLTAIFALNLCLGWTLLGWVVALVWSLIVEPEKTTT